MRSVCDYATGWDRVVFRGDPATREFIAFWLVARPRRGAGGGGAGLGSGAVAPDESLDFDLAAAGLRAEGGDALRLVEVLAVKLEDALPGRAAVERRGVRLLSKQKRVERIDVELGDATYQLISDGRKVTGMRGQAVRGVTIKREELGLDAWVERLTRELDELAQSSTEARAALDRLLGA